MLQQNKPEDFVIATGRMESVRKFIELSAKKLGWSKSQNSSSIICEGNGLDEIGRRADNGQVIIKIDPRYFRPAEVFQLLDDPTKAQKKLGWKPKTTLDDFLSNMVDFDLNLANKDLKLVNQFKVDNHLISEN